LIDDIENAATELLELLYEYDAISPSGQFPLDAIAFAWNSNYIDQNVVAQLAASRMLISQTNYPNGRTEAALTAAGIAYVQGMRKDRSDPQLRTSATRTSILRTLYDAEAMYLVTWEEFELGAGSHDLGSHFTSFEIGREARHLYNLGLIDGKQMGDEYGIVEVTLTEQGHSCVADFGGDVTKFNRERGQGNVTTNNNIYVPDNNGNLAINSSGFSQTVTSGVDTTDLLKFAGAVGQILPTLNLSEEQAEELRQESAELHEAASQSDPDVGLLHRLGRSILKALGTAAPTVASDLVLQLGERAVTAIGGA